MQTATAARHQAGFRAQVRIANRARESKPFSRLFRTLTWSVTIDQAIESVLQNKGARTPGVDGKTRSHYATWEDRRTLRQTLIQELRSGTYQPLPVRRIWIPKPHKPKEKRPLGIPPLRDRAVQEAVRSMLEPIYEQKFHHHSYGFRPYRSTHHAIQRIRAVIQNGFDWAIEGDIKGFFDNVDHETLMNILRRDTHDPRLLRLIRSMLKAGIMEGERFVESEIGTPQGGTLSPLLANIYLNELDSYIHQKYEGLGLYPRRKRPYACFTVRYADDFVILVKGTREQAEGLRQEVAEFLRESLRLELSLEKTLLTHVDQGFDFLGFHVRRYHRQGRSPVLATPSKKAQTKFLKKVGLLTRCVAATESWFWILQLNEYLAGWAEYYRRFSSKRAFCRLDHLLWWIIARKMRRRYWSQVRSSGGFGKWLKKRLIPYRHDAMHLHYRHYRSKNFGAWIGPVQDGALIVDQLRFYPIEYAPFHSQVNPYTAEGRKKLERDKKLNGLVQATRKIETTHLEPKDLSTKIRNLTAALRESSGFCGECQTPLSKADVQEMAKRLLNSRATSLHRYTHLLCKTCQVRHT